MPDDKNLEPKPAFNVPLPLWGKIVITVLAIGGLCVIAGIHIADCVQRHG